MSWYRWALALHIVSIISWMAGILYLYRLFIYHVEETESVVKARFEIMEERLARIIMLPAAGASFVFGAFMLALNPYLLQQPWMHAKLLFVVGLLGMTHLAGRVRRQLAKGTCPYSSKTLRILNEVPTLFMFGIVIMVIIRPWER